MNKPNMNDDMQRLEQKIDSFRELFEEKISNLGDGIHKIGEIEKRVDVQENRWNYLFGGAAVITVAMAIIAFALPAILDSFILDTINEDPCKSAIISIIDDKFFE